MAIFSSSCFSSSPRNGHGSGFFLLSLLFPLIFVEITTMGPSLSEQEQSIAEAGIFDTVAPEADSVFHFQTEFFEVYPRKQENISLRVEQIFCLWRFRHEGE